jgi:putative transposase
VTMRGIYAATKQSYGRPRMYAELRDDGVLVNHKRVGRLMKLDGLVGITRRRKWRTTKRDRDARPAPDLVQRNFVAAARDQLWVADITYIPTWSGFLYLSVVVDAWSRRVVGWSMGNAPAHGSGPAGAEHGSIAATAERRHSS